VKHITISVDLYCTVPNDTNEDTLQSITLEIPYKQIRIDSFDGPLKDAAVQAYCTQEIIARTQDDE